MSIEEIAYSIGEIAYSIGESDGRALAFGEVLTEWEAQEKAESVLAGVVYVDGETVAAYVAGYMDAQKAWQRLA